MPIRNLLIAGGPPGTGGNSFFNNLRQALEPYGVRVVCLLTRRSRGAKTQLVERQHEVELSYGDDIEGARAVLDYFQQRGIEVVIPSNNPLLTSLAPFVPATTLVLPVCNAIVSSAYHHVTRHPNHMPLIAVLSPRQRLDLIVKWGVSPSRIRLVPHGTNVPPRPEARSGAFRAVFVGRVEKAKGAHLLPDIVEAVAVRDDAFRLEVVGDGGYQKDVEQILERRGLGEFVVFRGPLPAEQVAAALSRAHVLVNPTQHDGFGLVTIEAMAHGAVPIASRIRGVTSAIVQQGRSGLLCRRRSPREFKRALVELHKNRERLDRMRELAYDRVLANFTLDGMAVKYLAVIRELQENPAWKRADPLPLSLYRRYERHSPSLARRIVDKVL